MSGPEIDVILKDGTSLFVEGDYIIISFPRIAGEFQNVHAIEVCSRSLAAVLRKGTDRAVQSD